MKIILVFLSIVLIIISISMLINYIIFGKKYFKSYYIYYLFFIKKIYSYYKITYNPATQSKLYTTEYYFFDNKYLLYRIDKSMLFSRKTIDLTLSPKVSDVNDMIYSCMFLNFLNSFLIMKLNKLKSKEIKYDVELNEKMKEAGKKQNRNKKLNTLFK